MRSIISAPPLVALAVSAAVLFAPIIRALFANKSSVHENSPLVDPRRDFHTGGEAKEKAKPHDKRANTLNGYFLVVLQPVAVILCL